MHHSSNDLGTSSRNVVPVESRSEPRALRRNLGCAETAHWHPCVLLTCGRRMAADLLTPKAQSKTVFFEFLSSGVEGKFCDA
eukprot:6456632-Amphidinium_carterae.1